MTRWTRPALRRLLAALLVLGIVAGCGKRSSGQDDEKKVDPVTEEHGLGAPAGRPAG